MGETFHRVVASRFVQVVPKKRGQNLSAENLAEMKRGINVSEVGRVPQVLAKTLRKTSLLPRF